MDETASRQAGPGWLFRLEKDEANLWRGDELAVMLRHQLAASPEEDLKHFDPAVVARLAGLTAQGGGVPPSYRELFRQPGAHVEWLDLTKRFAKAAADDGRLPRELAAVLYLTAICAAYVHGHGRLTELDSESLARRIAWAVSQSWLDEEIRQLLLAAVAREDRGDVRDRGVGQR